MDDPRHRAILVGHQLHWYLAGLLEAHGIDELPRLIHIETGVTNESHDIKDFKFEDKSITYQGPPRNRHERRAKAKRNRR